MKFQTKPKYEYENLQSLNLFLKQDDKLLTKIN